MADQEMQESQPTVDLQKHHPTGVATAPTLNNIKKIVSSMNWGCKLDLRAIALRCRNAVYNPKRLPILIARIREPKTTAYIFASGNMICIGAKSELQNKTAARKYTRIMQKVGFPAKFEDFKIRDPNNVNFRKWLKGFIAHSLDGASSSLNSVDEVSESIKKLTI